MALYRKGQASMSADGVVTGYDTKWKAPLSLIRNGATIMFLTAGGVKLAMIAEILSDTEMRVIASDGNAVDRSDYVILLHDSLTVEGLAQDVAEALRYYQGKETEFERFIEIVKNIDPEHLEGVIGKVTEQADRAEAEAKKSHQSSLAAQGAATVAAEEVEKAKGQVVLAQNEVKKATEQVALAGEEVKKAAQEVEKAKEQVTLANNASDFAQAQADSAAESGGFAKTEADRAAAAATKAEELAKQLDATNLMRKDANLADIVDKAAARRNLDVDNIESSNLETKVKTKGQDAWLSLRQPDRKWGFWDATTKKWVPLGIEQGGLGADNPADARRNLQLDKFIQDNATRIKSQDGKTELRIGNDDWHVYRDSNDSESGYIPLSLLGGGTGANDDAGARRNLNTPIGRVAMFLPNGESVLENIRKKGESGFYSCGSAATDIPIQSGSWWMFKFHCHGVRPDGTAEFGFLDAVDKENNRFTCILANSTWQPWRPLRDAMLIGERQSVGFGDVTSRFYYEHGPQDYLRGGLFTSELIAGGVPVGFARFLLEQKAVSGGQLTLQINSNGKNQYLQFDENARLHGIGRLECAQVYAAGGIDCAGWISSRGNMRVGVTTQSGGNKDIYMINANGDPGAYDWANHMQGNWYNSWWQAGGVRGQGTDLHAFRINVHTEGNTTRSYDFTPHGRLESQSFYGRGHSGGTAWIDDNPEATPFFQVDCGVNNDGFRPVWRTHTQCSGGYPLVGKMGFFGRGSGAWADMALSLGGDGYHQHRIFFFSPVGGDIAVAGSGGFAGDYIFSKSPMSDRSLKHDIKYHDGKMAFDLVKQYKPTTFVYNKEQDLSGQTRRGLIAQDMMKLDKGYVRLVPAAPAMEGEEQKDDSLALDENVILLDVACATSYMAKKIEEQEEEIKTLKSELEELKALVKSLAK